MTDSRFKVFYGRVHIRTVSAKTKQDAIDRVMKSLSNVRIDKNKLVAYEVEQ